LNVDICSGGVLIIWCVGNPCVFPDTESVIYSATRERVAVTTDPCRWMCQCGWRARS